MKSFLVLTLMIVVKVFGNVYLSRGMHHIGTIELMNLTDPFKLIYFALRAASDPWIILAVTLMTAYFILYLSSLSWLDLSFVLPIQTAGYILNTLLAWLILAEYISGTRWIGTFFIAGGVLVVGSEKRRGAYGPGQER